MYNRRHKLPATFFIVCIIAFLGFKDTGIFVKDFVAVKEEGVQTKFVKEEKIEIIKETKSDYIVRKENINYEIPKDAMIRTTSSGQKYKALKENTEIIDQPYGNIVGFLNIGEEVQALNLEDGYGLFEKKDGIKGYVDLKDLEKIVEESITYGVSKVTKVVKTDKKIYTLVKGETVAIESFKNNSYIVIDEEGNKFNIDEKDIEIKRNREKVSRGNVSSRAKNINKVVSSAYESLNTKYVNGGTTKSGYDCSGLTFGIFSNALGIKLPRTSLAQSSFGVTVPKADLIPGDLIFFKTTSAPVGHVGIYIGDGNMIHASTSQKRVIISDINSTYYKTRYVNSKRVIQ